MTEATAVAGALGAALVLLSRERSELLGGLALLGAATAGLALSESAPSSFDSVGSAGAAAAIAAAALLLVALAAMLVRWPIAVAPLLLVTAPLRLPIEADTRNELVLGIAGTGGLGRLYPLYAVLVAAVLALAWRLLRGGPHSKLPRMFAVPAAAFVGLTALSLLWSRDVSEGADQLVFFWFPFVALIAVVVHAPLTPRSTRLLATTLVVLAALFALIGLWQAISEDLIFFTVALERANELGPLFRVNAAFQDPNHYGRFLVLGLVVLLVALWTRRLGAWRAAALIALLFAGLYFSYSQSSMVSLIVVAVAIVVAAGDLAARRIAAMAAVALLLAGGGALAVALARGSAPSFTSDRSTLIGDTASVFADHPVAGVGVGAQPLVTREEAAPGTATIQNASHTTPLTVAAELGIAGLAAFALLVAGSVRLLLAVVRRDPALGLGLAAVVLALFVHSLFYGGLFESPIVFGALALAAAASAAPAQERESRSGLPGRRPGPMRS